VSTIYDFIRFDLENSFITVPGIIFNASSFAKREILYLSCNYNYLHMELRFMTFNSIIHGNLMPWLEENQDPEKFRLILRNLAAYKPKNSAEFIGYLAGVYTDMGISPGQDLIDEWGFLVITPWHPLTPGIIDPFLQLQDNNPRLTFYTQLIAHSMAVLFTLITIHIAESENETLQKHRVMGYMKGLSMMISSAWEIQPAGLVDQAIISRLLAGSSMLFAEVWNRFNKFIEPLMLRVNKTDIRNIFAGSSHEDENTRALYAALEEKYFPVSVQSSAISHSEAQNQSDTDKTIPDTDQIDNKIIMDEVAKTREDITALKEALAGANQKKKELQQEAEDRRIGSAEVCKLLNISKSTLKAHRDKGLYSYTNVGSRYYYSFNEINGKLKYKRI
jgi:hypothetical protein